MSSTPDILSTESMEIAAAPNYCRIQGKRLTELTTIDATIVAATKGAQESSQRFLRSEIPPKTDSEVWPINSGTPKVEPSPDRGDRLG